MGCDYYQYVYLEIFYDKNIKDRYDTIMENFRSNYGYISSEYDEENNKISIHSETHRRYFNYDLYEDHKLPGSCSKVMNKDKCENFFNILENPIKCIQLYQYERRF